MQHWLKVLLKLITIFILNDFAVALRLIEVRLPNYAIKGTSVQLECIYGLDNEALYSVKWYKDGNEFYRYVPRDIPSAQTFILPGISVDLQNSSDTVVTLINVSLQTSGRFRCEVSGEAPSFQTVTEHADMAVAALPDHGYPKIYGGRRRYQVNDWVNLNCTSGYSKPPIPLSWYINDVLAEPYSLHSYDNMKSGTAHEELDSTILGLQFRVEKQHFYYGDLKLKCVAALANFYWRSSEESVQYDHPQRAPVLKSIYSSTTGTKEESPQEEFVLKKFLSFFMQQRQHQQQQQRQQHSTVNSTSSIVLTNASLSFICVLVTIVVMVCQLRESHMLFLLSRTKHTNRILQKPSNNIKHERNHNRKMLKI